MSEEQRRMAIDYSSDLLIGPIHTDGEECYLNIYSRICIDLLFSVTSLALMNIVYIYAKLDPHMMCAVWTLAITMTCTQNSKVVNASCLAVVVPYLELNHLGFHCITAVFIVFLTYASNDMLMDVGGKTGVIALFSNLVTLLIYYLISLTGLYDFKLLYLVYNQDYYLNLNWYVYVFAPLVTVLAVMSVYFIVWYIAGVMVQCGKLHAYGLVLFIGCVFFEMAKLKYFIVNSKDLSWGYYFVDYWHVGCFVGITSKFKFKKYVKNYNAHNYIIAGYLAGWMNILVSGIINFGGRQGFVSFITCYIWIILLEWFNCCCQFKITWIEDVLSKGQKDKVEDEKIELTLFTKDTHVNPKLNLSKDTEKHVMVNGFGLQKM